MEQQNINRLNKMKHFTGAHDVTHLSALVDRALAIKANPFSQSELGKNKKLVMLFFNPSLRTRLSTHTAAANLGMTVMSMNADQGWKIEMEDRVIMNLDRAEHVREAAQVISQYADIIAIRSFPGLTDRSKDEADEVLNRFMQFASKPIISLESATRHPLQSLTDLMTIKEHTKTAKPKIVLSWAPHPKSLPHAVANSFLEWTKAAGHKVVVTHPPGYELTEEFMNGHQVEYDQHKAFENADFVYTKNWSSVSDYGKVLGEYPNWMIDGVKMDLTNGGKFMHCLPVRRNVVVADEVLDGANSLAIEQANNRTFAAQAVLENLLR